MKIVVDTNVFVSGLLSPFGFPSEVTRLVLAGKVQCLYDARILLEYREVLSRPGFHFSHEKAEVLVDQIKTDGMQVAAEPLTHSLPDSSDGMFLEVALTGRADFLVTGNLKHFPLKCCHGIKVLEPSKFIAYYKKM